MSPYAAAVEHPAARRPPRLLDQVRDKLRKLHYSHRTEEAYVGWIKRSIWFHNKRHPKDMGAAEVEAFLSNLATRRGVSASTQNQARCGLLFLYKQVLGIEIGLVDGVTRAKRPERVPVVLTREEVAAVLGEMHGRDWLMARARRTDACRCPRHWRRVSRRRSVLHSAC